MPQGNSPPVGGIYRPYELFDKRVAHRHIKEGYLTQAEYDAHVASLEDCTGKFDMVDPLADGEVRLSGTRARTEPRTRSEDEE